MNTRGKYWLMKLCAFFHTKECVFYCARTYILALNSIMPFFPLLYSPIENCTAKLLSQYFINENFSSFFKLNSHFNSFSSD